MKKAIIFNKNENIVSDDYDIVYFVGMDGKERDPRFQEGWDTVSPEKRGIIYRLGSGIEMNDNLAGFSILHNGMEELDWNNENPVIIDIAGEFGQENRFGLAQIVEYGEYVDRNFKLNQKPLLRVTRGMWEALVREDEKESLKLLKVYDLLLVEYNALSAPELDEADVEWWEYEKGLIAYDRTAKWNKSPSNPFTKKDESEESEVFESKTARSGAVAEAKREAKVQAREAKAAAKELAEAEKAVIEAQEKSDIEEQESIDADNAVLNTETAKIVKKEK